MESNWNLFRVLPNIEVPLTFESLSNQIAVVPYGDARASGIRARSVGSNKLWSGFQDIYGHQQEPSGLIYREELEQIPKAEEAITAFRNIVALVSTLPAWAYIADYSQSGPPPNPQWADAWSLYPVEVSAIDTLITTTPAVNVGAGSKTPFVGMPNPLIPLYRDPYGIDWPLFALLLHAWDDYYLRRRITYHHQLFRALEIAMHALALPTYNLTSLYDVGLSLSIWVSAFEVLLHPGGRNGKVNEKRVLAHLERFALVKPDKRLLHKRYIIEVHQKRSRVAWLSRVYHQLYSARNAYLHGNPVLTKHWRYDSHRESRPIGNLAPVVFRTALRLQLGWHLSNSVCQVMESRYSKDFVDFVKHCDQLYEDAMVDAM